MSAPAPARGFRRDPPHRLLRLAAKTVRTRTAVLRAGAPMVSVTFDDAPASAHDAGAPLLEEYGARGTFYVAAGTCGTRDEAWDVLAPEAVADLHRRGHEIACHTHSHVSVQRPDAAGLEAECRRNRAALEALCPGLRVANFAYPYGDVGLGPKLRLQRRYDSCRGIYEGVNAGRVDLGLLKVIELYERTLTADKLRHVLDEAERRAGWLIFYTHDVAEAPSRYGCSPGLLRAVLEETDRRGLDVLSVRAALARGGLGVAA